MFKLVDISGKDKGLVATQDIPQGTVILVEQPYFTNNEYIINKEMQMWRFIELALEKDADFFMSLTPHNLDDKYVNMFLHCPIISLKQKYSNKKLNLLRHKYLCNVFDYKNNGGILKQGTYFNHSCLPNVIYKVSQTFDKVLKPGVVDMTFTIKIVFKAAYKITKGEELCISYINYDQSYEKRSIDLGQYLFNCKCPRCANPKQSFNHQVQVLNMSHNDHLIVKYNF